MSRSIDIGGVLSRLGIQGKRSGKEWFALCPNPEHEDRKPSWRMRDDRHSPKHGMHKCHACGFGGGLIGLVSIRLGIERWEAKRWLVGDEVEHEMPAAVEVRVSRWSSAFTLPPEVIQKPLTEWSSVPRKYLQDERGVTPAQVDRWSLGYAVDGRLEGRIVLPKMLDGSPVSYTARSFVGHHTRYMEPKPHEKPSMVAVFGEEHWEGRELLFVAEGGFNALAIERARDEHTNLAALQGSELTPIPTAKLATFRRIVLVADADAAGDKLTRALTTALARYETEIVRAPLPQGCDANDLPPDELGEILARCTSTIQPPRSQSVHVQTTSTGTKMYGTQG